MKPPRIFFIMFLCLALTAAPGFSNYQDCDKIEANAIVKDASQGQSDGSVKVELVKGSRQGLRYIFYSHDKKRFLNEEKYDQNTVSGLAPGEYLCVVTNDECTKKINFTIK